MDYNLVRTNAKLFLINEIIRLRVLSNTTVDLEKIKPSNDIKEWLFTHKREELFKMYQEQLKKLGGK